MLLLCSNGLSSKNLIDAVRPFVQRGGKAALVVTADPEYKEKNYHVPRCTGELQGLGLTVETVDLDASPASELLSYDAVEFIGGNPFYLLDSIRKNAAADVLKEVTKKKVLIGWSAAAFVFGPSLELVNEYTPEMNTVGLTDLTATGLCSVFVLPHYDKFLRRFENFEEKCRQYEADHGCEVLRLNDGDGVLIHDGKMKLIRA